MSVFHLTKKKKEFHGSTLPITSVESQFHKYNMTNIKKIIALNSDLNANWKVYSEKIAIKNRESSSLRVWVVNLAISRIDLIGKWGLTPVLEPRQDPPSCGESQNSLPPPLYTDR